MIQNKYIAISECDHYNGGAALLFTPDDKTLYFMSLFDTKLIKYFIIKVKYKNKKRCQICLEKQLKHFKQCSQCNKEYCNDCFTKSTKKYISCPYCRYDMKQHIYNNIKKYKEKESEVFRMIIETKKCTTFH